MRVQRVVLEHHRDVALLGLVVDDVAAVHANLAVGRPFQSRDQPQCRTLPAAARADDHEELAVPHFEVDALDRRDVVELLAEVAECDGRHGGSRPCCGRVRIIGFTGYRDRITEFISVG